MSLGIAFKGPEGIVLAADSRVTLTAESLRAQEKVILPCTFDNATKLLRVTGHDYVGVVTYGLGALGQLEPRTAHSFLPEFEGELSQGHCARLQIRDFAAKFGAFFMRQWESTMPADYSGPDMVFLVGGFDAGEPYGKVFEIHVPSHPIPEERNAGQFGIIWGGQLEYTTRLIKGFDPQLPSIVQGVLKLTDDQRSALEKHLESKLSSPIPYPFLPLQDCVDLAIFLIRTTMEIQTWIVGVRGVGGAIDVATITRTEGFRPVQQKTIYIEICASASSTAKHSFFHHDFYDALRKTSVPFPKEALGTLDPQLRQEFRAWDILSDEAMLILERELD